MSFILFIKSLFRAIFYRMPKVGDVYTYDVWDIGDPWDNNYGYDVYVIDVKRGWVKYKMLGRFENTGVGQDEHKTRFVFHSLYKKVNEAEKV